MKNKILYACVLLSLGVFGVDRAQAQQINKAATEWWPDPATGLMWTETGFIPGGSIHFRPFDWQQAMDYCASLKMGDYAGWHLPSLAEVKALEYTEHNMTHCWSPKNGYPDINRQGDSCPAYYQQDYTQRSHDYTFVKGIYVVGFGWTSTDSPKDASAAYMFTPFGVETVNLALTNGKTKREANARAMETFCVRPMEPELTALAKQAQVDGGVTDVNMLKAYILIRQARQAYIGGDYQQSLTLSQSALALSPKLPMAYWGIGVSQGMLGNWKESIANLISGYKIVNQMNTNKDDSTTQLDGGYARLWADASQKAAKKNQKAIYKKKPINKPEWPQAPWADEAAPTSK